MPRKRRTITRLVTSGGPCGDGVEVSVEQVARNKCEIVCSKCGASVAFKLPGGQLDRVGFAKLEAAVARLHEGDA